MTGRGYSRPFYDANGFFKKTYEGVASSMTDMEFAVFMAKLEKEKEEMAAKREAFLLERSARLAELGNKAPIDVRWQNPDDHWD